MMEPVTCAQIEGYLNQAEFLSMSGNHRACSDALKTAFALLQLKIYGVIKYDLETIARNPEALAKFISNIPDNESRVLFNRLSTQN